MIIIYSIIFVFIFITISQWKKYTSWNLHSIVLGFAIYTIAKGGVFILVLS